MSVQGAIIIAVTFILVAKSTLSVIVPKAVRGIHRKRRLAIITNNIWWRVLVVTMGGFQHRVFVPCVDEAPHISPRSNFIMSGMLLDFARLI